MDRKQRREALSRFTKFSFIVTSWCAILLMVSCQDNQSGLPKADPDNGGLFLPDGFEALVVIDSAGKTRHIAVNENGDIYAKLRTSNDGDGGTLAMRDLDGDGRVDSMVRFGDYEDIGQSAVGVQIYNGYLYTSTVRQVLRNKLEPGELVPTSRTEIILTDEHPNVGRNWHTTKPLAFDVEGRMYVPFGSPSDAGHDIEEYGPTGIPGGVGLDPSPERDMHAGIWRFAADQEGQTQKDGYKFATGIRSVVGMGTNPVDGQIYAVVNGIDNFHTIYPDLYSSWDAAVLPAEVLIKVTENADFGWPYAYYDQIQGKNVLAPAYGGDGKIIGRAADYDLPVIGFPGHWAPMDILFYQGDQFPERYKNGAFVAFHGSTDRSPYPQAGFIVCFVPFDEDGKAGYWEVFADGFTGVDTVRNTGDAVYRPMGLSEGPDGSLYISESNKGKIWRVMYKGDKKRFGTAQLQKMKERESQSYIKTPVEDEDNLDKGSVLEGRILYNTYCASCHQRDGKGDRNRFPPLASSSSVSGPQDYVIDVVLHGIQGEIVVNGNTYDGFMPGHAAMLDDHAVASIVSYIRTGLGNTGNEVTPEDVKKVRDKAK